MFGTLGIFWSNDLDFHCEEESFRIIESEWGFWVLKIQAAIYVMAYGIFNEAKFQEMVLPPSVLTAWEMKN